MKGLNDLGYATFIVCILFPILATIAVLARLWTRRLLKTGLGADDWWMIAGMIAYLGYSAAAIFSITSLPHRVIL